MSLSGVARCAFLRREFQSWVATMEDALSWVSNSQTSTNMGTQRRSSPTHLKVLAEIPTLVRDVLSDTKVPDHTGL